MCGILAWFSKSGSAGRIDPQIIQHRGPDQSGEWHSPGGQVWFGFRRLAILDLQPTGAQPMTDPVTGNVIVFNGEIYNHRDLRRELDGPWRSEGDTATVLAAYRKWGPGMLERLKGMFAMVIFDAADQSLFVARDRFGIKPLYYSEDEQNLVFASEVKAIPSRWRKQLSADGLARYLRWGACQDASLIFEGIKAFPAAHALQLFRTGERKIWRYWHPTGYKLAQSAACQSNATTTPALQVRQLLEQSVAEHLLSDVPVASFLSGGIDSSIITALAARHLGSKLHTFTLGFENVRFDESPIAREVARRYATPHHHIQLNLPELEHLVVAGVQVMDLPSVDALNTYIVTRKASEAGIKVALSGLGADEFFGGYPIFREFTKFSKLGMIPNPLLQYLRYFGATGKRIAEMPRGRMDWLAAWRRSFWNLRDFKHAGLPFPASPDLDISGMPDDFARISWAELNQYMANTLLRDSDQMSMAVSLELRVPFLDHKLVEYVLSLPAAVKRGNGQTKALLVESCRDLLPSAVYDRRKMGFVLPMDDWMRGSLADFVKTGIRQLEQAEIMPPAVIGHFERRFRRRQIHWNRLWSLVVLGHYLKGKNLGSHP